MGVFFGEGKTRMGTWRREGRNVLNDVAVDVAVDGSGVKRGAAGSGSLRRVLRRVGAVSLMALSVVLVFSTASFAAGRRVGPHPTIGSIIFNGGQCGPEVTDQHGRRVLNCTTPDGVKWTCDANDAICDIAAGRDFAPTVLDARLGALSLYYIKMVDNSTNEDAFTLFLVDRSGNFLSWVTEKATPDKNGVDSIVTFAVRTPDNSCYQVASYDYVGSFVGLSNVVCSAPPWWLP